MTLDLTTDCPPTISVRVMCPSCHRVQSIPEVEVGEECVDEADCEGCRRPMTVKVKVSVEFSVAVGV